MNILQSITRGVRGCAGRRTGALVCCMSSSEGKSSTEDSRVCHGTVAFSGAASRCWSSLAKQSEAPGVDAATRQAVSTMPLDEVKEQIEEEVAKGKEWPPPPWSHLADTPRWKEFQIYRWNPDVGGRSVFQSYQIDLSRCGPMVSGQSVNHHIALWDAALACRVCLQSGNVSKAHIVFLCTHCNDCQVLDALRLIKEDQDSTLAYRRSCREGICGSCSMNIDGVNSLACTTPASLDPKKPTIISPLPHMFVMKDLVVDLTHVYQQYKSIEPWLKTNQKPPNGREYRQLPKDRAKLDGKYECILCFCCQTSCPSYWWNAENFLGPAVLIQAHRWIVDTRDQYAKQRLEALSEGRRLTACHQIFNCAASCPKHLNPGKSIAEMKRDELLSAAKSILPLLGKK
eukprot:SM000012S25386  [mRNA]  locus=s12:803560:805497:+ [translate_table: standard]